MLLEKLFYADMHNLTVFDDTQRAETGYLYAAHFENNNGKHLGFSMTSVNRGPKLGIVRQPAFQWMFRKIPNRQQWCCWALALAAAGAFARKVNRKRRNYFS